MTPALFLVCALALPNFTAKTYLKEHEQLMDLLRKAYPGVEFRVIPKRSEVIYVPGWSKSGMTWRGQNIWRKAS